MADKDVKNLKKALKAELSPLLIGLRNDLTNLSKQLKVIVEKEPPKVQKIKVTNHQEFPDVQKVEVQNQVKKVEVLNPQKEVVVTGIKGLFNTLAGKLERIHRQDTLTLGGLFKGLRTQIKTQVFRVKVENQLDLTELLEKLQGLKQDFPDSFKISNSTPDQAIPVVLTSADRKRFYEVLNVITGGRGASGAGTDLSQLLAVLNRIDANTDGLELKADTVILNVDDLEALIAATNTLLTSLDGKDFATETTLALIKSCCDASKLVLDSIKAELVILNAVDFATEATLSSVLTSVDGIEALLTTLNAIDFATETTLVAAKAELTLIKGFVDDIESLLTTLNAKDFATETTLASVKSVLDLIKAKTDNLDVALSTLATESTQLLVKSELTAIKGFVDGIETLLASIDGKDFATETTLDLIKTCCESSLTKLTAIETLLTSLDGKDFATEVTLAKINTAQGAKTDAESASGSGSVIALLKRIRTLLAKIPSLTFIGDRLKVDALFTGTVTADVRTLQEKLADEGKVFMATTNKASIAKNNEKAFVLLKNPTGSAIIIRIFSFIITSEHLTTPVYRFYKDPTITSDGTALVATNTNFPSTTTAVGEPFFAPTVSSFGTLIEAEISADSKFSDAIVSAVSMKVIIGADSSILLTAENIKNKEQVVNLMWAEE